MEYRPLWYSRRFSFILLVLPAAVGQAARLCPFRTIPIPYVRSKPNSDALQGSRPLSRVQARCKLSFFPFVVCYLNSVGQLLQDAKLSKLLTYILVVVLNSHTLYCVSCAFYSLSLLPSMKAVLFIRHVGY